MKKTIVSVSILLIALGGQAQVKSDLKTFKNKDVKLNVTNLKDLKVNEDGTIELKAILKKDKAENIVLNQDLVLQKREEISFDFEAESQKKKNLFSKQSGFGASLQSGSVDLVKADVLEVTSTVMGVNTINKGKIGLKTGLGFAVQKGDIRFVTEALGDRVRTYTQFVSKEEIKFKSDEGKNIVYEFHSSNAEALQVEFSETDSYNRSKSSSLKSFIDQDGDLLLIGIRRPIIKFGKAPSNEDLLPYYYAYKISPKTMDIVAQNKFAEPVGRGIIYREALTLNKGIILVSAPTSLVKPLDPNTKNYAFRLIGNDTKTKFEFTHEVPSGATQFSQVFELADSSIILIAAINEKRVDKYFNQGTTVVPQDAFYTMTIKNGKVTQTEKFSSSDFYNSFKTPDGVRAEKSVYNPAYEITKNISNEYLPNGGMLSFWSLYYPRPENNALSFYMGDLALQFSPEGKLEAKYWIECKNTFKPAVASSVIQKNDHEFFWLTYEGNETGALATPQITTIDVTAKKIGPKTIVGDDKHFVSQKYPVIQTSEGLQFFGFDKTGKEFWTQKVNLK